MYRRTIFGYLWAFLPPLLAALTFLVLRKGGITSGKELAIPYALWVLCGAFIWQTFADSITTPMRLVIQAKPMLTKISFPREALLLAAVGEVIFNFLIRMLVLGVALLWFRVLPGWQVFLLPLPVIALIGLGLMISVICIPGALLFQDFEKGIPLVLPFAMVLSGAVVPLHQHGLTGALAVWNPAYPLLETCRAWITGQPAEHLSQCVWIIAGTVVLLFFGWCLYRISMPHVVSRIGS
jgi:lipopolysaccharide transport system permease protein